MGRLGTTATALGLAATGVAGAGIVSAGAQTVPNLPTGMAAAAACGTVFTAGSFGGFLPSGKAPAGKEVTVDATWDKADFTGAKVDLVSCVAKGGFLVDSLASRQSVDNTGERKVTYKVPADAAAGTTICQRSAVLGTGADGAKSLFKTRAVCSAVVAAAETSTQELGTGSSDVKATEIVTAPGKDAKAAQRTAAAPAPAPEVKTAPAPPPAKATAPEPPRTAAAATEPESLPRTGSAERTLVLSAGLLFTAGGFAAMFGARRRQTA